MPRARQNLAEWGRLRLAFLFYQVEQDDAEQAATLQLGLRQRGRQLHTVDALIAAVALRYNLTLLTTDKDWLIDGKCEHLSGFQNLTGVAGRNLNNWLAV